MLLSIIVILIVLIMGMMSVAFVTLLERKLLGLSQIRLGPNKVSFLGLLQPVMDGVKLLWKEIHFILSSQIILFSLSPMLLLALFIMTWTLILPWMSDFINIKYSSLLFFSMLGLGAYAVILTGWSSVSAFSKLGSLRGMLQSLSFEVALILLFFSALMYFSGFQMKSETVLSFELMTLWTLLWSVLSLMETNRAPFDLLEGESELISGFNIEMSSVSFVFLFLSEYGMVVVMSMILGLIIKGTMSSVSLFILCFYLFMRSCFPRVRYDTMMNSMWKSILPLSGFFFMLCIMV